MSSKTPLPPRRTLQQVYVERAQRLPAQTEGMNDYARFGEESSFRGMGVPGVRFLEETPLQQAFFSDANVRILQNAIRFHVWEHSGRKHVVGPQSEQELRVIMTAMFVTYGKHLPNNIPEQIAELNDRVVASVVPKILTEVEMYLKYLHDASQPMTLMDRPLHVSQAGTKSLEWGRPSPFAS